MMAEAGGGVFKITGDNQETLPRPGEHFFARPEKLNHLRAYLNNPHD